MNSSGVTEIYGAQRDFQVSRVYAAERAVDLFTFSWKDGSMSLQEVKDFADKVMKSRWLKGQYSLAPGTVYIKDGRGRRNGGGDEGGIYMPRWAREQNVILHELAHTITMRQYERRNISPHGRRFCRAFLNLVRRWMGQEEYKQLLAQFKEHRVKYTPRKQR